MLGLAWSRPVGSGHHPLEHVTVNPHPIPRKQSEGRRNPKGRSAIGEQDWLATSEPGTERLGCPRVLVTQLF